jgi:hypothetical protein
MEERETKKNGGEKSNHAKRNKHPPVYIRSVIAMCTR